MVYPFRMRAGPKPRRWVDYAFSLGFRDAAGDSAVEGHESVELDIDAVCRPCVPRRLRSGSRNPSRPSLALADVVGDKFRVLLACGRFWCRTWSCSFFRVFGPAHRGLTGTSPEVVETGSTAPGPAKRPRLPQGNGLGSLTGPVAASQCLEYGHAAGANRDERERAFGPLIENDKQTRSSFATSARREGSRG